jgi:hypothetical protein
MMILETSFFTNNIYTVRNTLQKKYSNLDKKTIFVGSNIFFTNCSYQIGSFVGKKSLLFFLPIFTYIFKR